MTVTALTARAPAQRLNLDSGAAPAAGSGAAALALADSLDKQIDGLKRQTGAPPSTRVSIALREAARDLLRGGEQAGEAGSARIMAGRTIADALAVLDAAVSDPNRFDATTLEAMARDLERLGERLGPKPPAEAAAIDRCLRDALAPVTQTAGPPAGPAGWFIPAEPVNDKADPLVRWAAGLQITDPTREAITKLDERLRAGESWVAYAPTTRRITDLVRAAAGPLETKVAWMTTQTRHDAEERLAAAIAPLLQAGEADTGGASDAAALLRRLADVSRLLSRMVALEDAAPAARDFRGALQTMLKVETATAGEEARLAVLKRVVDLAEERRDAEKDAGLVRQLKPALRAVLPAAKESETAMFIVAKRLTQDDAACADPAILNAISAHQRRVADLKLIADVNRLIAVPGIAMPGEKAAPGVAPEFKGLADWIFEIGQDLTKPSRRDLAMAELREVAGGAVEGLASGPLRRMRAAIDPTAPRDAAADRSVWTELSGDRTARLLDAADKSRAALMAAWNAKDVPRRKAAEQQARALSRVLALIDDAVGLRVLQRVQQSGTASPTSANLQQWPGWQVSPAALDALGEGLPGRIRAAVDLVLAGDAGGADKTAKAIETECAAALLAGRLEGLATRAGQRAERPGLAAVLYELGLGAPDYDLSWMAVRRGPIASVCRYAEEWVRARGDAKDKSRAAAVAVYMNQVAARVLEQVASAG